MNLSNPAHNNNNNIIITGGPILPLPDVIVSNTPPSSPLRRSHSYLSFHPLEKTTTNTTPNPHQVVDVPPINLDQDTPPPTPGSPPHEEEEKEVQVQQQLDHIQTLQRSCRHNLPQLNWPLPRSQSQANRGPVGAEERVEERQQQHHAGDDEHVRKTQTQTLRENDGGGGEGGQGNSGAAGVVEEEEGELERQRYRTVGRELRRIADQFEEERVQIGSKRGRAQGREGNRGSERHGGTGGMTRRDLMVNGAPGGDERCQHQHHQEGNEQQEEEEEGAMRLTVPAAVTRCLTASLMVLVWWRILNRFR
ncbi:hypothetical protein Pcinc_040434 [Petrolisthes cinctipes]|uniref:Uncharacterized protein n=1 Tax=Petrolisthes cinctipes TaxID=88211 RepID=A0AAE1EI21_PETCI|nr:hypothetical protein Pcinc_040434 [Petrolisthes cinctipes]